MLGGRTHALPRSHARPRESERDAKVRVLGEQSVRRFIMLAKGFTMVGADDDERVFCEPAFLEGRPGVARPEPLHRRSLRDRDRESRRKGGSITQSHLTPESLSEGF